MILRTIGQGGMGAVYQAKDMKRQTICAIKEMSLSMVPPDERLQAIYNFKIEAKMLWGLNHPNLPAFTGFFTENFTDGQRYFMVMEYIDGSTLEELLERNGGPFLERRVLGWARQLCDVLEYLHSQNPPIIFRDMKPGNIMLTRDGHIKLIDFGIARFFRPTSSQDTQLLGTPGFAPPEQYGKAQTDERSDIYSLAITLFQLLTNTLSETGFGLKDIRSINPDISPMVARALQKAASLSAEDRYDNIAAFRRALLGVGTFDFENGDQATTPEELAELCSLYPEEAADYLASGEIESWLREIGDLDLARAARHIRSIVIDPQEAVEQFLRVVMGPSARIRSQVAPPTISSQSGSVKAPPHPPEVRVRNLFQRRTASPLVVAPRTLDFGEVYSGISAPLTITVSGEQGALVQGGVRPTEPWIMVDQTRFDGMMTQINVRVNGLQLHGGTHYSGTIRIALAGDETKQDTVVTVEADIISFLPTVNGRGSGGKTIGADLDEEDDDEDLTMGNLAAVTAGQTQTQVQAQPQPQTSATGLSLVDITRDEEYKAKYGHPGALSNGTIASGWDPLQVSQVTPQQRLLFQRGLTFAAAFMMASLLYTLISQLPPLAHVQAPLPPSPWFIVVLSSMIPAASLGALLVGRNNTWTLKETINHACTIMGGILISLVLARLLWQPLLQMDFPQVQLVVLLLISSLVATAGIHLPTISKRVIKAISWSLRSARAFTITCMGIIGGSLGYLLAIGFPMSWFTFVGIGAGVIVGLVLSLSIDWFVNRPVRTTAP